MARKLKQFIVRKYILAATAAEALRVEKKFIADDVWSDEKWAEQNFTKDTTTGYGK